MSETTMGEMLADILERLDRLEGDRSGVWMAYYGDWSGIAVFPTELEALRHSQDKGGMTVEFCQWGDVR